MTREQYDRYTILELRSILAGLGGAPCNKKKAQVIDEIIKIRGGEMEPIRSKRGRPSTREKRRTTELIASLDDDCIFPLHDRARDGGAKIIVEGILDIAHSGAFLRGLNYGTTKNDVRVPQKILNENFLISGDRIVGDAQRVPAKPFELVSIRTVNGFNPREFEPELYSRLDLLPVSEKLNLSENVESLSAIDVLCPFAKGQRSLITVPENCDYLGFLADIVNAHIKNENCKVIFAGVDYKPEVAVELKNLLGQCEFVYSTFDQAPEEQVAMAELACERAKSLATDGENVVLVIDSLYKLVKAYQNESLFAKTYTPDFQQALLRVKKLLSVSRNVGENYLSLIAVNVLSSTPDSEVVCEEMKSACSMNIVLDAKLRKKRIYPPLDIIKSHCNDYEKLLSEKELTVYDLITGMIDAKPDSADKILKILQKYGKSERLLEKLQELYEVNQ